MPRNKTHFRVVSREPARSGADLQVFLVDSDGNEMEVTCIKQLQLEATCGEVTLILRCTEVELELAASVACRS